MRSLSHSKNTNCCSVNNSDCKYTGTAIHYCKVVQSAVYSECEHKNTSDIIIIIMHYCCKVVQSAVYNELEHT